MAAAAADWLAAVVTSVVATVVATAVSPSSIAIAASVISPGSSAVAPISLRLRLIDAQLYSARRYLR